MAGSVGSLTFESEVVQYNEQSGRGRSSAGIDSAQTRQNADFEKCGHGVFPVIEMKILR